MGDSGGTAWDAKNSRSCVNCATPCKLPCTSAAYCSSTREAARLTYASGGSRSSETASKYAAATRQKLADALLSLSKATPEGKEILDLQRATKFVPTKAENYKGIEAAARSAELL